MMSRLRRWSAGFGTAMLVGAFFAIVIGRLDPSKDAPLLSLALVGALYGVAVLGLTRVFDVRTWGHALAGLLCGPVPAAILMLHQSQRGEERAGFVLLGLVFGLFVGLFEWQRRARETQRAVDRTGN